MNSRVVFEVTAANYRFAGTAATLRELSLLFPMLLARPDQPQAQLFIAVHQMLQAASEERKAAVQPILAGFLTAREKCFRSVVDDMLQAKRQGTLARFLADYGVYLTNKLAAAQAWRPGCDRELPNNGTGWLLTFDRYTPTHLDVAEIYTLGRQGGRFFLMQDLSAGTQNFRAH
ncbi:hypothetical protein ACQHIH_21840 (plasmid) [Xanthomonas sontii]|uniref:hypothetical protein n=1 Tax=Xanthomonas sontii TaxID=2650745 RepID=UPI003F86A025